MAAHALEKAAVTHFVTDARYILFPLLPVEPTQKTPTLETKVLCLARQEDLLCAKAA